VVKATATLKVKRRKKTERKKIVLKGFFASIHVPSEEPLALAIDCSELLGGTYLQLINDLQDTLVRLDDLYAKRETIGRRSLRARYTRLVYGGRKRMLKFFPYPSCFINAIRYLRSRAYELLNRYAFSILMMEQGHYREKIYILPEDNAEPFLEEIDALNKKLEEIKEELTTVDISEIEDLLRRYGIDVEFLNYRDIKSMLGNIEVDLTPIRFEEAVEEWANRSKRVKQLLEKKKRELVQKVLETVKKRLEPIVKAMDGERRLKCMKERLEELQKQVKSLGLETIAETVIAPLIEVAEDPSKASEVFRDSKPSDFVSGRIASLLESL